MATGLGGIAVASEQPFPYGAIRAFTVGTDMTISTADPSGAQSHARAMAGQRVEAMPTVPPTLSDARPDGVAAEAMLWDEVIAAGGYASKRLDRGARLRLTDIHGDACVSMLIFNAEQPSERLNVADTVKVQWNAYLTEGRLLLSDMGRVLMTVMEDSAATHDAFCGASNERANARKFGDGFNYGLHPNGRDRFMLGVSKHGLRRRDVHPCVNWFKGARIAPDGAVSLQVGPFGPGRSVTVRAEMHVIVVLANCPHVLDPRPDYRVTTARATAWRGDVTTEDDVFRNATPEGLRAFQNVEDFYRR